MNDQELPKRFYCYIIFNAENRTYNGYTTNLTRRLRQHNGEIKGGARATSKRGPWRFGIVLTSDSWKCISTAMCHEWSIKYPTRKRPRPQIYNGMEGRIRSLELVFQHMLRNNCTDTITCYVSPEFKKEAQEVVDQFSFVNLEINQI